MKTLGVIAAVGLVAVMLFPRILTPLENHWPKRRPPFAVQVLLIVVISAAVCFWMWALVAPAPQSF
jgi:hypothetical protein